MPETISNVPMGGSNHPLVGSCKIAVGIQHVFFKPPFLVSFHVKI